MLLRILFVSFLAFPFTAWAVNTDSLKNHILSLDGDAQIEAAEQALKYATWRDSAAFLQLNEFITALSKSTKKGEKLELRNQYRLAIWLADHGHHEKALLHLDSIKHFTKIISDHGLLFRIEDASSEIYEELGSADIALEYSLRAMNHAKKSSDSHLMIRSLNSLGELYRKLDEHDQAISYYDDAIEIATARQDSFALAMLLSNKGISLTQLSRFDDAFQSLDRALEIATAQNSDNGKARILTNLGFLFTRQKEFHQALKYHFEAIELKNRLNNTASTAYSLNDLGELYFFLGDYRSAIAYSRRAMTLVKRTNATLYERDICKTISRSFEAHGQYYSSLFYHKKYQALKDTLVDEDNLRNIARLERMQELKQAHLKNQFLRNENQASALALTTQRWFLFLPIALALSLIGLIGMIWNTSRVRKNLLGQLADRNRHQDETNKELRRLLNEQESIFNIVTHDLKGPLVNILQLIELEENEPDAKEKKTLRQYLKDSASGAAQFIQEFNTLLEHEKKNEIPPLETVQLNPLIREILNDFQSLIKSKKISIHFYDSEDHEVHTVKTMLRHILHNLISNAIKFNPPNSSLFITISQGGSTRISIEDQGPGISEEDQGRIFEKFFKKKSTSADGTRSNGLGLPLVKLLCERLKGSIKVKSVVGEGSEFIVHLP